MFQQRAEIIYGQLLEYPEHRATLETALNLSKDQINITEEYEQPSQYTPIKVYTRIKGSCLRTRILRKAKFNSSERLKNIN